HPRYLTLVALPFVLAWLAAPIILKAKYATILKDMISNNLLDIKSFSTKELAHIFKQDKKVLSDLEASFLKARGKDAIWYGNLLKKFSQASLDKHILETLPLQDESTQVALIKMISPESRSKAADALVAHLNPERPETTIAILKLVCQEGFTAANKVDLTPYLESTHPVVRGFAAACRYSQNPAETLPRIETWINSRDMDQRQSGIICSGLIRKHSFIDRLLEILSEKNIDPIIPDIIIALSRLEARELNTVIYSYLSYEIEAVRMAALDALVIDNDTTLKRAVSLLGDSSEDIRDFAKEKIKSAEYRNNKLLVESLGIPSAKIRRGIFNLLEHMDIKEFDILMFAKNQILKSYTSLAMGVKLKQSSQSPVVEMVSDHLLQKKDLILENVIRVLAINDKSGKMKTAWRGIFSPDTRQRANAIELLSDVLDRKAFNQMVPLLESPTPEKALDEGSKLVKLPDLNKEGEDVLTRLLNSEDWVDVIMGLSLVRNDRETYDVQALTTHLKSHENPIILKEVEMVSNTATSADNTTEQIQTAEISMGEKILLLKEIDIFSGLSAEELAAIAAETEERDYPEDAEVIRQHEMGETVFLIIDGEVDVIMEQPDGKQVVLDQISSGGAFGEMALIDDAPRSATIKTVRPCRFLILHKQEFKETAMEFPRISLQICSVLSQRIRGLHAKFQIN
ncbi:MAG: cyclic nucleotide-binding domain-containing protein, partial [Desulfobacterales bacterium]|nr:cyclic nucleotide-binding domain-containing protein [Desulfobacterales bacterium]